MCIIGYYLEYVKSYHTAKSIAMWTWKSYELKHVMSSNGFLIFRFKDQDEVHLVLEERP